MLWTVRLCQMSACFKVAVMQSRRFLLALQSPEYVYAMCMSYVERAVRIGRVLLPERKLLVLWKVLVQLARLSKSQRATPFAVCWSHAQPRQSIEGRGCLFFRICSRRKWHQVTQALDFSEDVLVINRARLLRDTYFTLALNAMKHRDYPPLGEGF